MVTTSVFNALTFVLHLTSLIHDRFTDGQLVFAYWKYLWLTYYNLTFGQWLWFHLRPSRNLWWILTILLHFAIFCRLYIHTKSPCVVYAHKKICFVEFRVFIFFGIGKQIFVIYCKYIKKVCPRATVANICFIKHDFAWRLIDLVKRHNIYNYGNC